MADFISIKTTRLSADREVQRAIDTINRLIQNGSSVYLYELDNRQYSIHLRHPIGIAYADFFDRDNNRTE